MGVARVVGLAFCFGFLVVAVCDLLYGCHIHIVRNAEIDLINSRLYGPTQFGVAAVISLGVWRLVSARVLTPLLGAESPASRGHGRTALAIAMVCVGLYLGWCAFPRVSHHVSWCFVIYGLSVSVVALAFSRHQLVAFVTVSILGTAAEWLLLDPRVGYWTFVQPDLFGRIPAWEPFVYGWGGIVIHQLTRMLDATPGPGRERA